MISLCKIKNKKKPRSFHCRSDLRWYKAGREFTHALWLEKKFPSGKKIWNVPESLHCVTWAVHRATTWLSHSQKSVRVKVSPVYFPLLLLWDDTAWHTSTTAVSCCTFNSVFYTPPALLFLFFVSVSHISFFLASFYIFILFITLSIFYSPQLYYESQTPNSSWEL